MGRIRVHVFCLCLLVFSSFAHAQSTSTGALGGLVADPAGAAIIAAEIDLRNIATGAEQATRSDRRGEFLFSDLDPGDYALSVQATGFDTLQIASVTVPLGRTTRMAANLHIAPRAETVEVLTADELPAFDSPVNANLSPRDLAALPLDGRRFQSLAVLTPLASGEGAPAATGDSDNAQLSMRGLAPMHNSYALDGLNLTRAFDGEPRGGRGLPFTIAQEGVREFQVRAVGRGIGIGRDAGGSVDTITRRGERKAHGSGFFLLRNSGLGAANPFAVSTHYNNGSPTTLLVKPRDQREQFGGSLGGPLPGSKRLYSFVAAEGQRRSFPAVSSPSDPDFYNLSAVQTALLANRGVNTAATAQALSFLDSLTGEVDRHADEFAMLPRIDWQPSGSASAMVEWARVRFRSPSGRQEDPVVALGRASVGGLTTHTDSVLMHASANLSPGWISQLRAQWSRDAVFAETSSPLAQEPHTGPNGAAPEVSIAGDFSFGNAAALGNRRLPEELRTEAAADTGFHSHTHTISIGVDGSGIDERIGSRNASNGAYDYTSGTTNGHAGGLVDFITDYTYAATSYPNGGCPSIYAAVHDFCFENFTQTFGNIAETRFHTAEWTAFADDAWNATPHLHISAGVRYEYNRLPPPQHPNVALDAIFGSFASTSKMPSDTNNLAPHVGIAYAPGRSTVVRLGYSVHFGRVTGRTLQAALENTAQPASQTSLRLTPRTIIDPACSSAGTNFGYPATYTCAPFGPVAAAGAATVFSRGFQAPMLQTGEISVTQAFHNRSSLSASYIVALARQMMNTVDLNIAPSTARVAFQVVRNGGEQGASGGDVYNVPLYTARRTAAFGPVTGILSNGNGSYNALALQFEQRAAHGLTARVSWTYSKALDTVRSTGAAPNENAAFDPFQPLYDRAVSNLNHTHRVVAYATWESRRARGGTSLRSLAGGWSLSPEVLLSSGRPYSYDIVGGSELDGGRESLNGSGGATYLPSLGRNTLRLPWTETADLRLSRSFQVRDHAHLRFSAEAFNLLNHVNVTAVEQRAFLIGTAGSNGVLPLIFQDAATIESEGLTSRAFGVPSSSADSPARERRVQLGVRLEW